MTDSIRVANLTCRYGRTDAVTDLTFSVPEGRLFALLGPNGAGKTTTIRTLMNIQRPSRGSAAVFGVDSQRLGPAEFQAIGHVSENQKLPLWMDVAQLLAFCRPLYPTWDEKLAAKLVAEFDLPLHTKISRLSRGMRVKAAIVSSMAYRPRLLVLDEPFSGLDPVVREDLVRGVLELAGSEQWTVLISSHDLDEVERLVDTVGFIDNGRLVLTESLAELHQRFRRVEVANEPGLPLSAKPDWIGFHRSGSTVRFVTTRYSVAESDREIAEAFPDASFETFPMTLREIFIAVARQQRANR